MSPRIMKALSFLVISLLLVAGSIVAKNKDGIVKKVKGTEDVMGSPSRTHFNINQVSTWIYNDGQSDIKPDGNSGFIYPRGSNKAAVFQSGFVWGATINGEKRVGGATYDSGLRPGRVIGQGATAVREDEALDHVRIFRVRRDYANPDADFTGELNDGEGTEDEIFAQYELDWNNWPAEFGAPYDDVDGNGSYDPATDIPGVPGSDQTVWFVANDLDAPSAQSLYGSDPMGIEMQATMWGYNQTGAIGNMMFRKYKIINKSIDSFDSMYVSMWADPDLGDASDDYSGCDVDLSLMFTYNGDANDGTYGITPPAVGFDFFQGPIVPSPGDVAIVDGKYKEDFKNLPMSVHYFFINGDPVYEDPELGDYVEGTLWFHNLFEGKITSTGAPFVDPTTGLITPYSLSGDPLTGSGWVDGIEHQPGDRRQGMVAGPFNMAAGDTQEVVVAELVAGNIAGVDRLSAVSLLKFYDLVAQNTYDNFFNVPEPVPPPVVAITELDNEVLLNWDGGSFEDYASNGYEFQGYVVYQYPSASAVFDDARVVATYDLNDGNGKIFGPQFDTESGTVLVKVLKNGSDSGLKRFISLKSDLFKSGAKLNNGTPYYFAVTAYAINPDDLTVVPTVLESAPIILEVIPQSIPGGYSDPVASESDVDVTHVGSSDAVASVKVVDPAALTQDDYSVEFKEQHYYLGSDGMWHETNYPDSIGKSLGKDVSPAYLSGISYVASATTRDLVFTIHDLEAAPDYSYCDGVELTFPAGVTIVSAEDAGTVNTHPVIDGQTVTWGAEDTTENGPFHGGEILTVTVEVVTLPLTVDYIMWDDGWGWLNMPNYGGTGEYKHAVGSVTVTEETNYFRTENQWFVRNTTTDEIVLDKQRVYAGIDVYADFWDVPSYVGEDAAAVVDGFQVNVDGSFDAPINFLSVELSSNASSTTVLTSSNSTTTLDFRNYTMFGGVITSYAIDNFGVGTYSINELQQDYEYRFTGVYDEGTTINGVTVHQVVEGGSMATCFRMVSGGALATHPLNPNYGTAEPFLIRIPFEVWNVDDPENPYQVNLTFRDRVRDGSEDPFWAWNPTNRMYAIIVNSPYDPNQVIQVDDGPDEFNDPATWVTVHYGTNYTVGGEDVVKVTYANPIQIGSDAFTFTSEGVSYSEAQAKNDVKDINVFPNPYYGANPNEINKYQRYVTFNHLPPKATIRVFNLAGQLVRTVEKDDNTQFARWTLTNENELPVASGIYIAYIDMPDLGETKVLKVAVIQETQILDRY